MYNDRSKSIINPDEVPPIHIVGCGTIGTFIAMALAKLGITFKLYDFDVVEEHNIGNQLYSHKQIGMKKVDALRDIILDNVNMKVDIKDKRVTRKDKFKGIVFVLTDTMQSRDDIFKAQVNNFMCKAVIETRMGVWDSRIYYVNPNDPVHKHEYLKSLGDVGKIDLMPEVVSSCGTRQDVISTSMFTGSLAVMKLIRLIDVLELREEDIVNESIYAFKNEMITIEQTWK